MKSNINRFENTQNVALKFRKILFIKKLNKMFKAF